MSDITRNRLKYSLVVAVLAVAGYFLFSFGSREQGDANASPKAGAFHAAQNQPNPLEERPGAKVEDRIAEDPDAEGSFQAPSAMEPAAPAGGDGHVVPGDATESDGVIINAPPEQSADSFNPYDMLPHVEHHHENPKMSPHARMSKHEKYHFGPDPDYGEQKYDPVAQRKIYEGKHLNPNPRPLLEWGRELYDYGPFNPHPTLFGRKNLIVGQFLMYGDWRTGVSYNDDGNNSFTRIATKLNLDLDLKITSTERIHAFFTPLDQDNIFTRADVGGDFSQKEIILDPDPDAFFFEGDLGRIWEGASDKFNKLDLPIAGGIMPLLFQNGVWFEDAVTGFAFTIPARNSPSLYISNMDVTFFAAFDRVNTAAIPDENKVHLYGMNAFIESMEGYWEIGYGFTEGLDEFRDFDYHNFTVAFTKRYFGWLSNSIRILSAFGQDVDSNQETANGVLLLFENSLITHLPSTLVPYFNTFIGIDRPQSLARAGGAGGVLKNTGLIFETDGLTGFPKLDDTAGNTYGGALGIEYLFDLDRQIVVEMAGLGVLGADNDPRRTAKGTQWGPSLRFQQPLAPDWILRVNTMYGVRNHQDDLFGFGIEFRNKF
jgi:hypothetical protein